MLRLGIAVPAEGAGGSFPFKFPRFGQNSNFSGSDKKIFGQEHNFSENFGQSNEKFGQSQEFQGIDIDQLRKLVTKSR